MRDPDQDRYPPVLVEPDSDARMLAMLAHLLGIVAGFLGPLVIWLVKKEENGFAADQALEALNFQLTLLIVWFVVMVIAFATCGIGALLMPVVMIVALVFSIVGGVAANRGEWYRYPMTIRMIR